MSIYLYNGERLTRGELARKATRRKRGTCQDCGHVKPVRTVTFWASGFRYTVCADCEKAYRGAINWPVLEAEHDHSAR